MALSPWFAGMVAEPHDAKALRTFEAVKASRTAVEQLVLQGVNYEAAHAAFAPSAREIVETGWRPPSSAPLNGAEFVYYSAGRAFIGSLGGAIKRDPAMTGWVPLTSLEP